MNTSIVKSKSKKIYILIFIFALTLMTASGRWQILNASKFEEIQKNRVYLSDKTSFRGSIYAKDGTTLAYSEPRFDVYIWMDDLTFFENKDLQTRSEFLNKVAPIIDTTPEKLKETIDTMSQTVVDGDKVRWFPIAKGISPEKWDLLNDLSTDSDPQRLLRGFGFVETSERIYPEGQLASQLIGLTKKYKEDMVVGQGGLEGAWNGILNPVKGFVIQEDNAVGEVVTTSLLPTVEPKGGSSIYTTIDKRLQGMVEEQIKNGVEKFEAKAGSIVIMDPETGEIMAMANYPTYDPNTREVSNPDVFGNISISSPYENGSTGKALTLSTALDLGIIKPDTVILPEGHQGCEKIHRDLQPLCTWDKRPQPPMTAQQCFVASDNICFYHMATMINKFDFYKYLVDFGVGRTSGIDISGESYGNLKAPELWNTGDVAAFSYGHGYQLNVVQATDAIAAIANNGVRMQPHIVSKVIDSEGNVKEYKPVSLGRAISEETSATMQSIMNQAWQRTIADNEYHYYHLKNYNIGIKSGTALIADSTGYTTDINATYVGYDIAEDKKFIMLVRLEKPQIPSYDKLAYYNARIVWLDTFNAIKDYLGVKPQ